MNLSRNIYIAIMAIAGLVLGVLQVVMPELSTILASPLIVLLVVSLMFDISILVIGIRYGLMPLHMNGRFTGFLIGLGIYFLIVLVLGKQAVPL